MIGFTIVPLMYAGQVTTYRVEGLRPDGSKFYDFGATRDYAFQFGLSALFGKDMRSPYSMSRRLDVRDIGDEFVPATTIVHD